MEWAFHRQDWQALKGGESVLKTYAVRNTLQLSELVFKVRNVEGAVKLQLKATERVARAEF